MIFKEAQDILQPTLSLAEVDKQESIGDIYSHPDIYAHVTVVNAVDESLAF